MKRSAAMVLGLLAVVLAAFLLEEVRLLLFGWGGFLGRNVQNVTVNRAAVATGIGAVVLLLGMIHFFGRSLRCAAPGGWHFRWSLMVLIALVVMFAAGFSAIGLARHVGWLLSSALPI